MVQRVNEERTGGKETGESSFCVEEKTQCGSTFLGSLQ